MNTEPKGAFIFDTETAVNLTLDGIIAINRIDAEVVKYHTCLLLLSQGFERLMKLVICMGEYELQGKFPGKNTIKTFSHDLIKLADAIVSFADRIGYPESRPVAKEDMDFIRGDEQLRKLLAILTSFGDQGKYYDLNTLLDPNITEKSDPTVEFEKYMDDILRKNQAPEEIGRVPDYRVAKAEVTEMLQRFARALCRMFVFGPLGSSGKRVTPTVGPFLHLWDEDLSTPAKHLFKSVLGDMKS